MIFFYLLIFVMPLVRHPLWSDFVGDLTLIKYLGMICLISAMVHAPSRLIPLRLFQTWQTRLFGVLALLGTVSFLAKGPDIEINFSPLMSYASFILFFIVTLVLVDSLHALRGTLFSLVASITYASLHCLREWQAYGGFASGYRPGWITGDPNYYSLSAILCLPIIFYLIQPQQARWERSLLYFALISTLFATTLAASRGALVGIVASFILIVVRSQQRARLLTIGSLILLPLLMFAPSSPLGRLFTPTQSDRESTGNRIIVWEAGLLMIQESPLTGIGVGNFKPLVAQSTNMDAPTIAHNTYLGMAAELGLPGLGIFLGIFVASFFSLARVRRLSPDRKSLLHQASLGIECAFIAFMVAIFFISAEYQKFFWLLVFLSAALESLARAPALRRV
jgi:putative inorganic carbon (hco3(-)) transporter